MVNTNHVFSAFSCIGFILVSIPFAWHLEAWNTGTCLYMFWVGISCLTFFINSVVWDGNVVNWSPIWCDISTRVILATNVAIPACALCIQRRLYCIVSDPAVIVTRAERRRSVMVDSAIGFGLPIINIILTYIVQGHRFDIFEDIGCNPAIINTPLSFVIISAWPIVIGLTTGVYCSLNIYHFWLKRRSIKSLLEGSGSLNFSRYLRLMVLSGIDILCTVPLGVWGLYSQATLSPIVAWPGWKAVHAGFSHVDQIPAALWRSDHNTVTALELTRWSSVMCAIIFFMFFGFADEARRNYSNAMKSVAKTVGVQTFSPVESNFGSRGLQTFNRRPMSSIISFDDVVLPAFEKDLSSPKSGKLDPYATTFETKSTYTVNTQSDEKKGGLSPKSDSSSEEVPYTPISPTVAPLITPPPEAYDPESQRPRRVRPPVLKATMDGGFMGGF